MPLSVLDFESKLFIKSVQKFIIPRNEGFYHSPEEMFLSFPERNGFPSVFFWWGVRSGLMPFAVNQAPKNIS